MRGAFVPVFLFRKNFKCVLRWWGWESPFQRVGPFVPWIVRGDPAPCKDCIGDDTDEQQEGGEGEEGAPA